MDWKHAQCLIKLKYKACFPFDVTEPTVDKLIEEVSHQFSFSAVLVSHSLMLP